MSKIKDYNSDYIIAIGGGGLIIFRVVLHNKLKYKVYDLSKIHYEL